MFKEKDLGIFVNIIYNMLTKMPEKNAEIFSCESCHFVCSKKSNYDKHLLTRKHKTLTKPESVNFGSETLSCHYCHKLYNSRVGLWKHEKKCKEIHILSLNVTEIDVKISKSDKELGNEIRPLKIKVAYQRPCSSRLSSEKHHFVADIMNLIGVDLVERTYQDENALCCGEVLRMVSGYKVANDVQKRNIDDMVDSGAQYCVFNCPACYAALAHKVAKRGIKPIHMINLCRMAIGEK